MPNILYPYICWGNKEKPLHWDEEEAEEVCSQRQADEEY